VVEVLLQASVVGHDYCDVLTMKKHRFRSRHSLGSLEYAHQLGEHLDDALLPAPQLRKATVADDDWELLASCLSRRSLIAQRFLFLVQLLQREHRGDYVLSG